jgi:CDP-paratose 2-epimerase
MGGGRENSCSVIEAIVVMASMIPNNFTYTIDNQARKGDHKWWITDTSHFQNDYPGWKITKDLEFIYKELLGA